MAPAVVVAGVVDVDVATTIEARTVPSMTLVDRAVILEKATIQVTAWVTPPGEDRLALSTRSLAVRYKM